MLKNAFSKCNELLLLLQWFSDSIIRHKPVYGRYVRRLNFVYHSSLTSKLPLFNVLFQLADDSNFILHFGQNLLILSPQTISLHLFLVCSPSPFLTTGLAHTVFKDNQGIKGKAGARYWETVSEMVTVVSWSRSCVISAVVHQNSRYSRDEISWFKQSTQPGQRFYDSHVHTNTNAGISHFIYLGLKNSTHKHAGSSQ